MTHSLRYISVTPQVAMQVIRTPWGCLFCLARLARVSDLLETPLSLAASERIRN